MIHIHQKGLPPGHDPEELRPPLRQKGSRGDRRADSAHSRGAAGDSLARAGVAVLYAIVHPILQLVALVYFRRIEVLGREHLPLVGPVLLAINHPSTWADVVVLDVALGRKLHFITHERLFHPWPRRLILMLFGSLPVAFRQERSDSPHFNRETFARCHALFARGEVVAFFPEGVSHSDHTLLPLKTGAARLLLESGERTARVPMLLPVALWYEDRTMFRGDVTLVVAPPVATEDALARAGLSPDGAARALTGALSNSLAAALERAERHGAEPGRSFEKRAGSAWAAVRAGLRVMAAPFAWMGRLLHAPPVALIDAAAHRLARQPEQIAFARMLGGIVVLPVWYLLLGVLIVVVGGGRWFALAVVTPVLGWAACRQWDGRGGRRARAIGARVPRQGEDAP